MSQLVSFPNRFMAVLVFGAALAVVVAAALGSLAMVLGKSAGDAKGPWTDVATLEKFIRIPFLPAEVIFDVVPKGIQSRVQIGPTDYQLVAVLTYRDFQFERVMTALHLGPNSIQGHGSSWMIANPVLRDFVDDGTLTINDIMTIDPSEFHLGAYRYGQVFVFPDHQSLVVVFSTS